MTAWLDPAWLFDPAAWAGLATLIIIELVLGIDNLVFIAILAERLPPALRERARITGLSLALIMRLILLLCLSWLMGLTQPLLTLFGHVFSGRDLILLSGGLFLIYKATSELHDHIDTASPGEEGGNQVYAAFSTVVAQIVILDAVFSLDSIITAVGMVDHLPVMMIAIVCAMTLMLLASRPLMRFITAHPTVILLCLGLLLMIGFSLVAEGLGLHIPRGYLYSAIGFAIIIELLQTLRQRKSQQPQTRYGTRRARTAATVMRLLGSSDPGLSRHSRAPAGESHSEEALALFDMTEQHMVRGVLSLADKPIEAIMTLRRDIDCLDLTDTAEHQIEQLRNSPHASLVVIRDAARDAPLGIVRKRRLLDAALAGQPLNVAAALEQPLVLLENVSVVEALQQFQRSGERLAFVVDEFGTLEGIVTMLDILEDIAGEMPGGSEATTRVRRVSEECFEADASEDIVDINQQLPDPLPLGRDYTSLAGLVVDRLEDLPHVGARVTVPPWQIEVRDIERHRVRRVRLYRQPEAE
ncbi:putative tellurium resistance membrane protein TerC [Kushneria sinocarnis]|uniref:Putative tellurium resistance membrane protein TerC n=1 Tax=Kushneria sinocarnis TaxID=595502 RepID=A0A420WUI8_9GAMM|nr:transporter associated domain-containing protein [Kushneria sinocarnis]RKQ97090.1 putative tellurium resistance membrane protein TerC [Kushneria sinocarnis]